MQKEHMTFALPCGSQSLRFDALSGRYRFTATFYRLQRIVAHIRDDLSFRGLIN